MDNKKIRNHFGFVRRALAGALFGVATQVAVTAMAQAELSIERSDLDLQNSSHTESYNGGYFRIALTLSEDIESVTFRNDDRPYIELSGIRNYADSGATHLAKWDGKDDGRVIYFRYDIQPGDYSSAVDIKKGGLEVNGATITVRDGDDRTAVLSNDTEIPSLINDRNDPYTISISTFYLPLEYKDDMGIPTNTVATNRIEVSGNFAVEGTKYSSKIKSGGKLTSEVKFDVTVFCQDTSGVGVEIGDKSGTVGTIYAGGDDTTEISIQKGEEQGKIDITPKTATEKPVSIRIRPALAGTDDSSADLYIIYKDGIDVNEVTIDDISVVDPKSTPYPSGEPILIKVTFSEKIRSVSSSFSSMPYLILNVENENKKQTYEQNNEFKTYAEYTTGFGGGANKDFMYFTYTVKPGDYIETLDVKGVGNFATGITFLSGNAINLDDVPKGEDTGSLARSGVGIQTIKFRDIPGEMKEDNTYDFVVTRGGSASQAQNFTVSSAVTNGVSGDHIKFPKTFSIPAGSKDAALTVTARDEGLEILRLHPWGYPDDGSGDLVVTNIVKSGGQPYVRILASNGSTFSESDTSTFTVSVSLSRSPKVDTTVEVTSSAPECLEIKGATGGSVNNGKAVFTFKADMDETFEVTLLPKNGLSNAGSQVTLTATEKSGKYTAGTQDIYIRNVVPRLNETLSLADGETWKITGFSERTSRSISWNVTDVDADLKALTTVKINFGDGTDSVTVTNNASGYGEVSHTYLNPKGNLETGEEGYIITLVLEDKNGGRYEERGEVIVKSAVKALIRESKDDGGVPYTSANTGYTVSGLGRGSIRDTVNSPRDPVNEPSEWNSFYNAGQGDVTFTGHPETLQRKHPATGKDAEFNSYFHVWVGESVYKEEEVLDPVKHLKSATVVVATETTGFTVCGVFSKEYYPEDNTPDIDDDQLPDNWEQAYWPGVYAFEHTGESDDAPYGAVDNPDHDYLPACATIMDDGTLGTSGHDYSPKGPAFNNLYEVRGTHWGLNASGSDPVYPQDEPHGTFGNKGGFYGTNPTSADTDGDLLTDGWEYFFWRMASVSNACWRYDTDDNGVVTNGPCFGEAYDGTKVIEGKPLECAVVAAAFNPCDGRLNHLLADTDGDGLTNFEEFLLGTNPTHWDTDGDTMNDGWEVMWGLDPCNIEYNDGTDPEHNNPDGDYMAYVPNASVTETRTNPDTGEEEEVEVTKTLRHNEVYQLKGFNPRTAWGAGLYDRARLGGDFVYGVEVDTVEFTNVEEHRLGRWFIDQGLVDEVEPMSRDWMSQPVPYNTSHYYDKEWKKTSNHIPDHRVKINGEVFATGGGDAYTVPYGDQTFQVEAAPVITRKVNGVDVPCHGCDGDCDGMPDGWELYLCLQKAGVDPVLPGNLNSDGNDDKSRFFRADGTPWITGLDFARHDMAKEYDQDGLNAISECHSVALCDYYATICDHGFYNSDGSPTYGNWYNKWWPCDPFDADTDGDGVRDGDEGNAFDYQTRRYSFLEDGLPDPKHPIEGQLAEVFGNKTMRRGHVPGGGLNPCCVDTDMDYIPDGWEFKFAGTNRDLDWEGGYCNRPGEESALVVDHGMVKFVSGGGGMDGTYFDSRCAGDEFLGKNVTISNQVNYIQKADGIYRDFDFDHDGLENYQEYLVNGVRHFQYDKWEAGKGYGGYDIQEIFAMGVIHDWDWAKDANNWQNDLTGGDDPTPFFYMPPEARMDPYSKEDPRLFTPEVKALMTSGCYASTDPRLADSDGDNMDDYYELFHGLNPILSDVADYCGSPDGNPANGEYDFLKYPWMAGMPEADPDYDDKPNCEEALSPGQPAPANHNTDPSPLWMTDMSYSNSFVNLYYNWGTAANFWTVDGEGKYNRYPRPQLMTRQEGELLGIVFEPRPAYMFSFECNEGYDTDNDNIPDPYEVDGVAGGVTDPQNPDRPVGRKALYLDGSAAARTRSLCAFGPNALRSFTLEAWVRPEAPVSTDTQVILERPVAWKAGNAATSTQAATSGIRRNFRLALDRAGRPFVEFDNGGADLITESAIAGNGAALEANRWYHLAAVMDGFSKTLSLYVNGERVATKSTSAIPYTGFTDSAGNSIGSQQYLKATWAPLVIGAADSNPEGKVDGGKFYDNGAIEEIEGGQPQLSNYFKGWIDEVRIWDGARPAGDDAGDQRVAYWGWPTIRDDYDNLKRYGLDEALAAQNDAIKFMQRIYDYRAMAVERARGAAVTTNNEYRCILAEGMTFQEFRELFTQYVQMTGDKDVGGEDSIVRIPPALLCAYSFDALPDADYEYRQPAKFETLSEYRPADYVGGTPWLAGADDRTLVYREASTRYPFPQYAQNWVAWLPLSHIVVNGYDTGYSAIREGVAGFPLYTLRADSVANSKYWTRDAKGGVPVNDLKSYSWTETSGGTTTNYNAGYFNTFPNSANPYGYRYETGLSRTDEVHPTGLLPTTFAPEDSALFNDLLPLRTAVADMDVQMWDDPDGDGMGVNVDGDGDGMPDWWELENGLDPHDADQNGNGVSDAYDDFDGDGLSNYAEHRAGTNPRSADSDGDGVADFFESPDGSGLAYGAIFMDNDHVLDGFEQLWDDRYASPFRYDEDEDRDFDGWDNWSEALVSPATKLEYNDFNEASSSGGSVAEASIDDKAASFPMPALTVTLHHTGDRVSGSGSSGGSGRLVVHAYTDAEMNGWPDAVIAKTFATDTFPVVVELDKEDVIYGHLRQGANWFFAWVEQDGSKLDNVNVGGPTQSALGGNWPTWTPGEPAAVADYQAVGGIGIGWDRNNLSFHLVENQLGYVRYSFQSSASAKGDHTISVGTQGSIFFTKKLKWPRVWLHEGDMQTRRTSGFGVSSGIVSTKPNTYGVAINGVDSGSVTNWFTTALAAPVLKAPRDCGLVFSARPEFEVVLPDEATEFQITVNRGSTQVYSARVPAPGRNQPTAGASTFWRLPVSVALDAGATYTWTVKAYNAANSSGGTAATATFAMASQVQHDNMPAYGRVALDVKYPSGWAYRNSATPKIRVRAYRTASFNGEAEAQVALAGAGEATLYGLELDAPHYFMAFIDQDGDGVRDAWEPWGYYRKPGDAQPFLPVAITPQPFGNTQPYEIVLRDPDTDDDLMPDAVEYLLYGAAHPNDFLAQAGANANIGSLRASASALSASGRSAALAALVDDAYGDADGDGVSDMVELMRDDTDPGTADSDGDGIDDGDEKALFGSAAAAKEAQTLEITGISIDDNGDVSFEWGWSNASASEAVAVRSATASAAGSAPATGGLRRASAPPPVTGLRYVIEATDSLSEPNWREVKRVGALNGEVSGGTLPESGTGAMFFRIRLVK